MHSMILSELAELLGATLHGDGSVAVSGISSISKAKKGQVTFLSNSQHRDKLADCQASAVVLNEADLAYCQSAALVVKDPYAAYAKMATIFNSTPSPAQGISERAVIAPDAQLGKNVSIGPNAVIESGVTLGDNVTIGAGCFIGKNSQIGANTTLWANVTVYHSVVIGEHCLVQANTVIGSDGFGYANDKGKWVKIPQLGSVVIGNYVEIGACTSIDRGALDDTIICDGVIIDNQCQIAHNVYIGEHTAVAGGVIMAGSLKVGRHCMIGGASVFNGHMEICDNVTITGMAMVMRPITKPGVYSSGIPAQTNKEWRKTAALVLHIDQLQQRIKEIERKVKDQ